MGSESPRGGQLPKENDASPRNHSARAPRQQGCIGGGELVEDTTEGRECTGSANKEGPAMWGVGSCLG